jgi:hypothetical protein
MLIIYHGVPVYHIGIGKLLPSLRGHGGRGVSAVGENDVIKYKKRKKRRSVKGRRDKE